MALKRDTVLSVSKGIAIILMVAGHAEAPELVTNFIYTFHMPLFFMAAGYFFSRRYLDDPWSFISKRVKGLYYPFLKWSIFFLLLHNVWFHFGILNEQYGNWTGGVTHPYTLRSGVTRLVLMVTSMSGYDEFMAGAFWFFRGLLVASVMFLLMYKLVDSRTNLPPAAAVGLICVSMVAFLALRIHFGIKLTTMPNGGWRECWGIFFFGAGVLFRRYKGAVRHNKWLSAVYMLFLCYAATRHFSGMNNGCRYQDLITLPLTGIAGFLLVYHISSVISRRDSALSRGLAYIGDTTLYIFIFHIIAFKPVSLLKIWWYGLDPGQIGCHMVIHYNHTDFFWVIYSVAGVTLPLAGLWACRRFRALVAEWGVSRRRMFD
ncbi:MAG TPA: hypothetical protein DCR26_08355 [Porphyromonadaceae bacterium]|nr:hypothetical protein [Porphyromonadaceae bacterium]